MNYLMNPLISVIVPVYNVERYLNQSVQSVLRQDYHNLEIVLIDDGSTDKSGKICDKLAKQDSRIKVIHKKNGGVSDARNVGIHESKGDYITLLDSDDEIDSDYVSYLYSLIERYKCPMSLCTHREYYEKTQNTAEYGNHEERVLDAKTCLWMMCYHDQVSTSAWAKLYHKDLFTNIEYPVGKKFEDIGTTYQLFIKSKKVACGFMPKYTYRIRENSITTSKYDVSKLDMLEMTDKMARDVLTIYPELSKAVARRRMYARFSTLNQLIGTHRAEKIKSEITKYIKKGALKLLFDKYAPIRDKIAVLLLFVSPRMYEKCWLFYLAHR